MVLANEKNHSGSMGAEIRRYLPSYLQHTWYMTFVVTLVMFTKLPNSWWYHIVGVTSPSPMHRGTPHMAHRWWSAAGPRTWRFVGRTAQSCQIRSSAGCTMTSGWLFQPLGNQPFQIMRKNMKPPPRHVRTFIGCS